jgi:hypothetical protein
MGSKKFGVALVVILLSSSSAALAQSYVESALLFSRTKPYGSSRIQALGGAQIALGGDYSSSVSNPAGLGMFNKSEVTLSTGLSFYKTNSTYKGTSLDESTSRINIPGVSLVYHIPNERSTDFISGSFAISMSRVNDFNRSVTYEGKNEESSIIDSFLDNAWGNTITQFDTYNFNTPTGLAYYNYLIGPLSITDPNEPDDEYFSDASLKSFQRETIETRGSSSQVNIAYGANYQDILFLGAGIGIISLKYSSEKTYSEDYFDDNPEPDVVESMTLKEDLSLSGTGVNLTIGAIVRPVSFLQIGTSFTTPTYYAISERYSASMNSVWDEDFDYYGDGSTYPGDYNNEWVSTDELVSDYALSTPLKLSGGLAFISKFGFITGDIEWSNFRQTRYSSSDSGIDFSEDNDQIKSVARKSTITYRIGAEGRFNIFRVRAGYSSQGKTFSNDVNFDNRIRSISGGVGIRKSNFSVDFALVRSSTNSFYNPYYSSIETPVVRQKDRVTTGVVTVGFSF